MPVLVGELGPIKINCLIWTGVVSRSEAFAVPDRIDPSRPEFGARWISYFDAGVDISDLDGPSLVELRERFRPLVAGLAAKGDFQTVLVSNSRYNDPLLNVWRAMTASDDAYASSPEFVHDIPTAAHALGLSGADADDVQTWIAAQLGQASGAA